MGPLHFDSGRIIGFPILVNGLESNRDGNNDYLLASFLGDSGMINRLIH